MISLIIFFSRTTKQRDYETEAKRANHSVKLQLLAVSDSHPLRPILEAATNTTTTTSQSKLNHIKSSKNSFSKLLDPLSADELTLDPLSLMVANVSAKEKQETLRLNEIKSSF